MLDFPPEGVVSYIGKPAKNSGVSVEGFMNTTLKGLAKDRGRTPRYVERASETLAGLYRMYEDAKMFKSSTL